MLAADLTQTPAFIAVDWGTTNRRIYALAENGTVITTERDGRGVLAMTSADYPAELASIRARFGDVPVLCAGAVGSVQGWVTVPYLACPTDLRALAGALHWIEPARTAIVPGLSSVVGSRGEVMRGEEVQFLGAVTAGLAPQNGLLCQPGTHCKWAVMEHGRVASFRSAMTGELFALLRRDSLIAEMIAGPVADGAAFRQGLADSKEERLLGNLFGIRAGDLLGLRPRAEAASYASGLLIGTDVREQAIGPDDIVHLLASDDLAALYTTAIAASGARTILVDSHAAFVAGITALWSYANAN